MELKVGDKVKFEGCTFLRKCCECLKCLHAKNTTAMIYKGIIIKAYLHSCVVMPVDGEKITVLIESLRKNSNNRIERMVA